MKKIIFLNLFIFLFTVSGYTQGPVLIWQKTYGGSQQDYLCGFDLAANGSYFLCGASLSNDGDVTDHKSYHDSWVIKTDTAGKVIWKKSYGGTSTDAGYSICGTNDGGCIMASLSESFDGDVTGNHGYGDFWVTKIDSSSNIQWQMCYGGVSGDGEEWPYAIKQSLDGGYFVVGSSSSTDGDVVTNYGHEDYWIIKINSTGTILWKKVFGGNTRDVATNVLATADGGCLVVGYGDSFSNDFTGKNGNVNSLVIKLQADGTLQWKKLFGGTLWNELYSVKQDGSNYILAGGKSSGSNNHGDYDFWLLQIDAFGNYIWDNSYGGSYPDIAKDVIVDFDGNYILTGYTLSSDQQVTGQHDTLNSYYDIWLIKVDRSGNLLWQKTLGGKASEVGNVVKKVGNNLIIAGSAESNDGDLTLNHGDTDYWLVKLKASEIMNVAAAGKEIADFTVYPNPLKERATIQYHLPGLTKKAVLTIYDVKGCFVKSYLLDKAQSSFSITSESLPNGVYFADLELDGVICVKKKIVVIN